MPLRFRPLGPRRSLIKLTSTSSGPVKLKKASLPKSKERYTRRKSQSGQVRPHVIWLGLVKVFEF